MILKYFKLTVKIVHDGIIKIYCTAHPMIHFPTNDPEIIHISKFGGRICFVFKIHYESCAFAMLPLMNLNEFADNIRKTKC